MIQKDSLRRGTDGELHQNSPRTANYNNNKNISIEKKMKRKLRGQYLEYFLK